MSEDPVVPAEENFVAPLPTHDAIELVFGLVGPTGVDLSAVCDSLTSQLKTVGYESKIVNLSQLILPFTRTLPSYSNEFDRIDSLMTAGTALRRNSRQADIVARLGLAKIRALRQAQTGSADCVPPNGVAYIVRSFKRPEEVQLFRNVYGRAFTLVSVYAPRESRKRNLARKFTGITKDAAGPEELAVRTIMRDFTEAGSLGQKVSSVFPLADFFVTTGTRSQLDDNLRRLVRLIFGDPYLSPTRDEQGMFFAQAAALRSLDLSRQVGAAITSSDGEILSSGCNEVPKFGGGLYWEGDEGATRDFEQGFDSNASIKKELVTDALRRLRAANWLRKALKEKSDEELAKEGLAGEYFRDAQILDVIEFGRAVHAEMAAITQAARIGTPIQGARLFCTTFPCHICARHIVAAGIQDVVFIEPYEKSRADQLFGDSISVEPHEPSPKRVNFRAFVGVSPRRYMDYFSLSSNHRKTDEGKILDADEIAAHPRIKRFVLTYLVIEAKMVADTVRPEPDATPSGDA